MPRRGIPNVSIYKPKARGGPRHKWLIWYMEDGKPETESVSCDYQVTRQYAMEVSRRLDRKRLGLITDLDERRAAAAAVPLPDHARAFHAWLLARGVTAKQAGEVLSRVLKVIGWCEFRALADLSASKVQAGVNDWRDENDRAAETCNKYLKDAAQFSRWLWKVEKVVAEHVLCDLRRYNVEADRRHVRRALSAAELDLLLAAALAGADYQGMAGEDRWALYLLAAFTGLRRSELASLTAEDFALAGADPTVTVQAAHSKHRRQDVLPLRADLVEGLRDWLAGKKAGKPVFAAMPDKAFLMLYEDLGAAGIAVQTPDGIADFHALRHTFITILGRTPGVSMKTVQQLARHSDIRLTARYMHMQRHDERRALEGLPPLPARPDRQQARATGTYGPDAPPAAHPGAAGKLPAPRPERPTAGPKQGAAPDAATGWRGRQLSERSRQGSNLQPSAPEADALNGGPADRTPEPTAACIAPAAAERSGTAGNEKGQSGTIGNPGPCASPCAPPPPHAPMPAGLDLATVRALHAQLSALLGSAASQPAPPGPAAAGEAVGPPADPPPPAPSPLPTTSGIPADTLPPATAIADGQRRHAAGASDDSAAH